MDKSTIRSKHDKDEITALENSFFLAQYEKAKEETILHIENQIKMVLFLFPLVFSIYAFTITQKIKIYESAAQSIFFCIIPGLVSFSLVVWLDQVYRMLRVALFSAEIENMMKNAKHKYWEHWIENISDKKFFKADRLIYYTCLGTFIMLQTIMPCVAIFVLLKDFKIHLNFFTVMYLLINVMSYFFAFIYIKKIIWIEKKKSKIFVNRGSDIT